MAAALQNANSQHALFREKQESYPLASLQEGVSSLPGHLRTCVHVSHCFVIFCCSTILKIPSNVFVFTVSFLMLLLEMIRMGLVVRNIPPFLPEVCSSELLEMLTASHILSQKRSLHLESGLQELHPLASLQEGVSSLPGHLRTCVHVSHCFVIFCCSTILKIPSNVFVFTVSFLMLLLEMIRMGLVVRNIPPLLPEVCSSELLEMLTASHILSQKRSLHLESGLDAEWLSTSDRVGDRAVARIKRDMQTDDCQLTLIYI
ncbi:uncharacterized protein LOC132091055 [Carassius carassius]|uniref:uncharacterized protein LOC132091055 n=1 Tax=Carassius carassius TaxID=217509 RepID=UPI00286965AB|nr:uncharacterized protein LOC132091055 [Carassius carassius]